MRVLGGAAPNRLSVFDPEEDGTEPLQVTPDMVDGNNLLALTAATPLEEKLCAVTGKKPPPRTHVISDDVLG